ncbi:MAG: hypothetical protein WAU61_09020, partial [Smithella sp.]
MKKTLALLTVLLLLATPVMAADTQPATDQTAATAPANGQTAAASDTGITLKMMGVNVKFGGFLAA